MKFKKKLFAGDKIKTSRSNWKFNKSVVKVFDKHVSSSVPLYEKAHDLIIKMSDFFIKENSTIIDLGSSTGTLIKSLDHRHFQKKNVNYLGVDSELEMIKASNKKISQKNIKFLNKKIENYKLPKSDMITSIYTIQFIKPSVRQDIFDKIYKSLTWGGAFFLFEKVRGPDARFQDIITGTYNDYKLDVGYNFEEISVKTQSLRGVLEPFSTNGNLDLLKRAGFKDIMIIFKYICFEGFLAIK
jgi:tRNA (cmo5U34)-methyltransferase